MSRRRSELSASCGPVTVAFSVRTVGEGRAVPQFDDPRIVGGGDPLAVGAEGNRVDIKVMSLQREEFLSILGIPRS